VQACDNIRNYLNNMDIPNTAETETFSLSLQIEPIITEEELRDYYVDCTTPSYTFKPGKEKEYREFEKDFSRKIFWNALVTTINNIGFKPSSAKLHVLELACGRAESATVLNAFFSGNNFGQESEKITYVGLDIDQKELLAGQKTITAESKFPNQYRLLERDATESTSYLDIPQADIVVIRNQEMLYEPKFKERDNWTRIFKKAFSMVKTSGLVIITTPFEEQRKLIDPVLAEIPLQILYDGTTPEAAPKHDMSAWDTYITLCRLQ
jgi:SAM-dependent methyltransferase